jgi:hypothetical protein
MLRVLKELLQKRGNLSRKIIQEASNVPSAACYRLRFGSVQEAYKRIGFTPKGLKSYTAMRGTSNEALLEKLTDLLRRCGYLSGRLIDRMADSPSRSTYVNRFGSLRRAYELIGYTSLGFKPDGSTFSGRRYTKKELLQLLREFLKKEGRIRTHLLNTTKGFPSATTYRFHFGSYARACKLIGYNPPYRPSKTQARPRGSTVRRKNRPKC